MKKQQIITGAFLGVLSCFSAASGEVTFFEDLVYWHASQETTSRTNNSMLGSFMVRGFMGLEWIFKAKALVMIKVGYEMQFWSNQLRLPVFQALPIHGDLTLQGATCGILINL